MLVPELRFAITQRSQESYQIAIVGIETHICVTQTALDLLSEGHRVYVITDGVSSCHEGERGVALQRLRSEGAIVTSSESFIYECMGDASIPEYVVTLVMLAGSELDTHAHGVLFQVQSDCRACQRNQGEYENCGRAFVQDVDKQNQSRKKESKTRRPGRSIRQTRLILYCDTLWCYSPSIAAHDGSKPVLYIPHARKSRQSYSRRVNVTGFLDTTPLQTMISIRIRSVLLLT